MSTKAIANPEKEAGLWVKPREWPCSSYVMERHRSLLGAGTDHRQWPTDGISFGWKDQDPERGTGEERGGAGPAAWTGVRTQQGRQRAMWQMGSVS